MTSRSISSMSLRAMDLIMVYSLSLLESRSLHLRRGAVLPPGLDRPRQTLP